MTLIRRRFIARFGILAAVFVVSMQPQPAVSQGRTLDRAVFLVSRGSDVIGREELRLHSGQLSETGTGFEGAGFTVSVTAYYPSSRSYASATSIVHLSPDSLPSGARLDLDGSGQPNAFVDFTARRITVRNRTSAGESAGQYPRPGRVLLVDESLLSMLALLPGTTPGSITLFYPRTGRMSSVQLADHGSETTVVSDVEHVLRHLSVESRDLEWHLWYDSRGRLLKLEIPADGLTAVRTESD